MENRQVQLKPRSLGPTSISWRARQVVGQIVKKRLPPPREGKEGKGVRLRQVCGFCGARFRSRKERNQHTNLCEK